MIAWQTYYRPQKLADLHLSTVREQMQNLVQNGALPQVMLFAGPKGTGKTSTARIIASMLNTPANQEAIDYYYFQKKTQSSQYILQDPDPKEPQIQDIMHGKAFSVVEIDAASNRGIDDVRQLQEQAYLPPSLSQVIVYILDEVHMFTPEAFNALLKILEEPPAHAFFILATTESHKIPATVVSRCTVINFTKANPEELISALEKIASKEKIKTEKKALEKIALLADGSFRDAVKLMQTVHNQGAISLAQVNKLLAGDYQQKINDLMQIILKKDDKGLINFFASLRQNDINEKHFTTSLFQFLHQQLIANIKGEKNLLLNQEQALFLLQKINFDDYHSFIPFLNLEIVFLEILLKKGKKKE